MTNCHYPVFIEMEQAQNEMIVLGTLEEDIREIVDYTFLLVDAESSMRPMILNFPKEYLWLICGICWLLFFLGSYFKYFLYQFLFDEYKKKSSKPIDVLTLLLAITQHATIAVYIIKASLAAIIGMGLENIGGNWFCTVSKRLVQFELMYSIFGSLGISIFRILYIKHDDLLRNIIGEKKFLYITAFGGIALSTFFVILMSIADPYEELSKDLCSVRPTHQMQNILINYEKSKGNDLIH